MRRQQERTERPWAVERPPGNRMEEVKRENREGKNNFRKRPSVDSGRDSKNRPGSSGVKNARYKNILIFQIVWQCYCCLVVGGLYAPQLAAYDCNKIEGVELRSAACLHSQVELVRSTEMIGLSETDYILSEAISCEARVKIEKWYCGTASHVHILDVPHERQVEIGIEECRSIFHSGKFQYDGSTFQIATGLTTSNSFVVNGSLSAFPDFGVENIQCKTLGVFAHNEWFSSGFGIATLHVLVKNTPVLIKGNLVMDYDKYQIVGKFSENNRWAEPSSKYFPYVIRKPASDFKVIFQDIFNVTRWNQQLFVSNLERNILVKVIGTEKFVLQHLDFNIILTELEGLKFLEAPKAAVRSYFGDMLREESRFDLNSMFVSCRERNERLMEYASISKCVQTETKLNRQMVQGYRMVFLGELAKYEKCTSVKIPIVVGKDFGCATGHLLVEYNGEVVGIQEYSRLVVSAVSLEKSNCSVNPLFLKLSTNLFVGNQGRGIEILHIGNTQAEHLGQKLYLNDEAVYIKDFNSTIKYQGIEDFNDFYGQASKIDTVEHKLSFFDKIMSPIYSVEHLFTDIVPLFAKFLIMVIILTVSIVCLGTGFYCCYWCYKKRYTEEEFRARVEN